MPGRFGKMADIETCIKNNALDLAIKNSPLSITQFCYCLKCSRVTLWRIVNNRHTKPKPKRKRIIIQLCAILGSTPEKFGFPL